jgi:hypothetical protein
MDPDNHVVRLCAEGMRAESEARPAAAQALFEQAWADHTNDFEACIAAHYLARHQATDQDALRWNEEALAYAHRTDAALVTGFYASLHLNLGHSLEKLGDLDSARRWYESARGLLASVPEGPYKEVVARGIASGFARLDERGTDGRSDEA